MKKTKCLVVAALMLISGTFAKAASSLPVDAVKSTASHGHYINTEVQVTCGENAKVQGSINILNKVALQGWRGTSLIVLKDQEGNIIYRHYTPNVAVNGHWFSGHDVTKTFAFNLPQGIAERVYKIEISNMANDTRSPVAILKENLKGLKNL